MALRVLFCLQNDVTPPSLDFAIFLPILCFLLQKVKMGGIMKGATLQVAGGPYFQMVKLCTASVLPLSIERIIAFRVNTGAMSSSSV